MDEQKITEERAEEQERPALRSSEDDGGATGTNDTEFMRRIEQIVDEQLPDEEESEVECEEIPPTLLRTSNHNIEELQSCIRNLTNTLKEIGEFDKSMQRMNETHERLKVLQSKLETELHAEHERLRAITVYLNAHTERALDSQKSVHVFDRQSERHAFLHDTVYCAAGGEEDEETLDKASATVDTLGQHRFEFHKQELDACNVEYLQNRNAFIRRATHTIRESIIALDTVTVLFATLNAIEEDQRSSENQKHELNDNTMQEIDALARVKMYQFKAQTYATMVQTNLRRISDQYSAWALHEQQQQQHTTKKRSHRAVDAGDSNDDNDGEEESNLTVVTRRKRRRRR